MTEPTPPIPITIAFAISERRAVCTADSLDFPYIC
jgi:hypothetical protein